MAKIIPKKVSEKVVKLRDQERLSWAAIGQQTSLHRETVRKQYCLEKGEAALALTPEEALVPSGQTGLERSSVTQKFELFAKKQEVLQVISDYIAVVKGKEWNYVEDDVVLLKGRLNFLKAEAEDAKDVDTLSKIHELALKEMEGLEKLGEQQVEAENKAREREGQKKLSYATDYFVRKGGTRKDITELIDRMVKRRGIEGTFQLVKDMKAIDDLHVQCLESGIDTRFVDNMISLSMPKVPDMIYVRQLWWDTQKIYQQFGPQEFASFWASWGKFVVHGRQALWQAFMGWRGMPQPAWGGYQFLQ